ncbi:MAG: fibronectin type III domain-containing protein [Saprospiraceae bacterium]|nr:fibronectin type III domain-containing protein [Saprospiraceae bacterium]
MRNFSSLPVLIICSLLVTGLTSRSDFASTPVSPLLVDTSQLCPAPAEIQLLGVTDSSLVLSWQQSDSVLQTDILYREDGGALAEATDVTSPWTLTGLAACTRYEVILRTVCADGLAESAALLVTTDGTECCNTPAGVQFAVVGDTFALVTWSSALAATRYAVRYKRPADTIWTELATDTNRVSLANLKPCKRYEVQLQTVCGQDSTGYSDSYLLQTDGCGTCTNRVYCAARGYDASQTFIDSISIGAFRKGSGNNGGYIVYTADPPALERDRNYMVFVQPGYAGDTCDVYIRAWLDLDQDGEFIDSTELVVDAISDGASGATAAFMLAGDLPLGITRLRVILTPVTDTLPPVACGAFNFGEVEDYCVRIDDLCPFAAQLDTLSVSEDEASIIWEGSPRSVGYIYRYREVGTNDWEDPMITMDTTVELTGLKKCNDYEFELTTVCIQDTTRQSLIFSTDCPSATHELPSFVDEMLVYPNPTSGLFSLRMTTQVSMPGVIRVVDLVGRVWEQRTMELAAGQILLEEFSNLADAPAGMYFVVVNAAGKSATRRLVKL